MGDAYAAAGGERELHRAGLEPDVDGYPYTTRLVRDGLFCLRENELQGVVAVGRSEAKLARVRALDSRVEIAAEPPTGIDLAISAVSGNDPSFIERSLPGLRDGGALVILATPGKPPRFSSLVARNLSVHGSLWFPRKTVSTLVDLIASGVLNVDCVSSHGYALDDVDAALAHVAAGVEPLAQVVVRP